MIRDKKENLKKNFLGKYYYNLGYGKNKKHFSSFLRDFQLPKIVSDLRVRL